MVIEMRLPSTDETDFTNGLNPFLFGHVTPEGLRQEEERARQYDIIHRGAATTLADTVTFLVNDDRDITLPTAHETSLAMLIQVRAALVMLLGPNCPWNHALQEFIEEYQSKLVQLRRVPLDDEDAHKYPLIPCYLVRWVQTRLTTWLIAQANSPVAVAPHDLSTLWMEVFSGGSWMKVLPQRYRQRISPVRTPPEENRPQYRTNNPPSNHQQRSSPHNQSQSQQGGGQQQDTPSQRSTYVMNLNWDQAHFQQYRNMGLVSRDVRRRASRPAP